MEIALVIVLGVLLIIGFSLFAKRLGLAAPVVLVIGGVVISYLPGVPQIELQHDIILLGVLPPILYAAAITVPVIDFRRNVGTIASLSVLLVIVSAFGSGFVLFMLLPNLDLAAAVALGAVISPPDAVAATAIGKRLGLPPRLVTVLEGEGLLNDATALVLLRSAIAVVGRRHLDGPGRCRRLRLRGRRSRWPSAWSSGLPRCGRVPGSTTRWWTTPSPCWCPSWPSSRPKS